MIGEVIQRIISLYSKGVESDDARLSRRHVYNKLLTVRARLIVERIRKNQPLSEWDLQPLHCIEMVSQKSIPCGPSYKCPFMKSKYPLPPAVTADNTENVEVTSFDGAMHFSRTTFEAYKYLNGNKYSARKPYYYIHDNYLYLINSRMTKAHMHGIWRDPAQVWRMHLTYQGKDTCFSNNDIEIFTPLETLERMIEMSAIELLQIFNQGREDISSNSRDTILEESK